MELRSYDLDLVLGLDGAQLRQGRISVSGADLEARDVSIVDELVAHGVEYIHALHVARDAVRRQSDAQRPVLSRTCLYKAGQADDPAGPDEPHPRQVQLAVAEQALGREPGTQAPHRQIPARTRPDRLMPNHP